MPGIMPGTEDTSTKIKYDTVLPVKDYVLGGPEKWSHLSRSQCNFMQQLGLEPNNLL